MAPVPSYPAPKRERTLELDPDLGPGLRAPARLEHHAQDAVDAEPGVPETSVEPNLLRS